MLANINNDALKITLAVHQNLAGSTTLIPIVPLLQITSALQKDNEEQGFSITLRLEFRLSQREKPSVISSSLLRYYASRLRAEREKIIWLKTLSQTETKCQPLLKYHKLLKHESKETWKVISLTSHSVSTKPKIIPTGMCIYTHLDRNIPQSHF